MWQLAQMTGMGKLRPQSRDPTLEMAVHQGMKTHAQHAKRLNCVAKGYWDKVNRPTPLEVIILTMWQMTAELVAHRGMETNTHT